jgi:hypothetical protein
MIGVAVAVTPSFVTLYSAAMRLEIASTSAFASSNDTPGLSRPITSSHWPVPRSSFAASCWMGIQIECRFG